MGLWRRRVSRDRRIVGGYRFRKAALVCYFCIGCVCVCVGLISQTLFIGVASHIYIYNIYLVVLYGAWVRHEVED
jgi:hypothetical protein